MNFAVIPETQWQYGYAAFWTFAAVFVVSFLIYIKKKKWV
jgi:Mg2+ and Co2+ transporter CorA